MAVTFQPAKAVRNPWQRPDATADLPLDDGRLPPALAALTIVALSGALWFGIIRLATTLL